MRPENTVHTPNHHAYREAPRLSSVRTVPCRVVRPLSRPLPLFLHSSHLAERALCVVVLLVGILTTARCTMAQPAFQLVPLDPGPDTGFGVGASATDALVAVGTEPGRGTPRAYVFRWDGNRWVQEARLVSDRPNLHTFGAILSAFEGCILLGVPWDSEPFFHAGSAYVFCRRNGNEAWENEGRLSPHDAAQDEAFGLSVALRGETAVIGTPGDTEAGFNAGAVYVFRRGPGGWTEETKLIASGIGAYDGFGSYVVAGDGLFGAASDDGYHLFQYKGTEWVEETRLDVAVYSAALSGDYLVLGNPDYFNPDTEMFGAAYVYRREAAGWVEVVRLTPDEAPPSVCAYGFGDAVAIAGEGQFIAVGSPCYDGGIGAVHVFVEQPGGWARAVVVTDSVSGSWYGDVVALSESYLVVGAHQDATHGNAAGAAYGYPLQMVLDNTPDPPIPSSVLRVEVIPNPASSAVTVRFYVPRAGVVRLALRNVLGREVLARVISGRSGFHSAHLDISALPAGLYICVVEGGNTLTSRPLIVVN